MVRHRIDPHSLKVLEFEQVLHILAGYACSDLGRDAARALYPSVSRRWITKRLAETSQMKRLLEQQVRIPMAGLRDIRQHFERFGKKQTVFEPGELLEISDTLRICGRVREFLAGLDAAEFADLREIGDRLDDYEYLCFEINRCIDADKSVRDQASEKLADIRRQISHVSEQIRQRFRQIIAAPQLRRALENDKLLMRHGRPVVALKASYRDRLRGTVLDRSNTGATLYVEPDALVELSNQLEELVFAEKKEVNRILWELTRAVLQQQQSILASVKQLALIDLTYAKARYSLAYQMIEPKITADGSMKLRQARHPLLLRWAERGPASTAGQTQRKVVPVDVRLGDDFDLLVVTGPNTGGKTVLLKTIGLLSMMAQSGMHIPAAEDSQLPVFKRIYADIGDEQSIQQSLSTFSAHMQQIIRILAEADRHSLVLLDELGAGTDPTEGAVLARAILDQLLKCGAHVVATTHLGQLKNYAYTTPRAENASVQFDSQTLQPTYQVLIGTPGSSNALAIARRLGMPEAVVSAARKCLADGDDSRAELINQLQMSRQDAERKRADAEQMLEEARQTRMQAQQELIQLRQQAERLKDQADKTIDRSMRQVRELVQRFLGKMQNAPKVWRQNAEELADQIEQLTASTPLAVQHAKFIEQLRKGDSVYVIPFHRTAIVDRVHRKRKTLVVLLEGKQLQVPWDDVCAPNEESGR